jgi:hypothetical protein
MVQAVDGGLGLAEAIGDLAWREAGDMAQNEHLALILGKLLESVAEAVRALEAALLAPVVAGAHLLDRGRGSKAAVGSASAGEARWRASAQAPTARRSRARPARRRGSDPSGST